LQVPFGPFEPEFFGYNGTVADALGERKLARKSSVN
jgi:hypothetical protein